MAGEIFPPSLLGGEEERNTPVFRKAGRITNSSQLVFQPVPHGTPCHTHPGTLGCFFPIFRYVEIEA